MNPKSLVGVGCAVLTLSILISWGANHWLRTRTFEPVNMPVRLEGGKTQAVEFKIHLHETYWVSLQVDHSDNDRTPGRCSSYSLNRTRWRTYRLSSAGNTRELWADSETFQYQGTFQTSFRGIPGRYQLEWSVPDETDCLNPRHPRLTISTEAYDYEEIFDLIQMACLFLGGAGAMLVLRGLLSWLLGLLRKGRSLRIFPDFALKNVTPMLRHRPMPLIANLPVFAPSLISVLVILVSIFMTFAPPASRGFLVHFDRALPVAWEKSPWRESMSVSVDGLRGFYVNGRRVAPQDLSEKLKEELGKRMVWTVYFEADDDARVSDAEYAMYTIQRLGAKLIWVTPKTRKEFDQRVPK